MNAYTQTVGIYPEALKRELRDALPLYGAQRLVSLGYARTSPLALPAGRASSRCGGWCKWIVDETCDPADTHPLSHMHPAAGPWAAAAREEVVEMTSLAPVDDAVVEA